MIRVYLKTDFAVALRRHLFSTPRAIRLSARVVARGTTFFEVESVDAGPWAAATRARFEALEGKPSKTQEAIVGLAELVVSEESKDAVDRLASLAEVDPRRYDEDDLAEKAIFVVLRRASQQIHDATVNNTPNWVVASRQYSFVWTSDSTTAPPEDPPAQSSWTISGSNGGGWPGR